MAATEDVKPLHEVFMKRARGVAQACGERVSRFPAIRPDEPVKVVLKRMATRVRSSSFLRSITTLASSSARSLRTALRTSHSANKIF